MKTEKEFKDFLVKTVTFIKENIIIAYSLLLLVLIPTAFFLNTYYTNQKYTDAIESVTSKKVAMIEDILNGFIGGRVSDTAGLQIAVDRAMRSVGYDAEGNSEIMEMTILLPFGGDGDFEVVASSDAELIGNIQKREDKEGVHNGFAWASATQAIVTLDQGVTGRFWKATRLLLDESNHKVGLIDMKLSIANQDAVINKVISDSYMVLFLTLLVVVLMVANQARLVGYAVTVVKLQEVDKMKDMFISMASHELRSPLTAIKGYMELLTGSKNLNLDEETGRYVANINSSVQRLGNLVEDILDVSRLEGNRLPIEITAFDPLPPISKSVEEMRAAAIQKGLALNYKPGEASMIRADESRVKQVVVNLIGNAVKYTDKGSVDVTTSIKGNDFLITVADTGIGMSADDQANLFQKFYRIKNEKTRNISGTGLGLWITKEVVEKMGGKIVVESIEGVGSHFTVRLPIAASASKKPNS